jgi:toxin ParE1/3/4
MAAWRLTKVAAIDLADIFTAGIEQFGKAQALKYRRTLEDSFDTLASSPLLGREHVETRLPVRVHFHEAHVVAYWARSDGILILRVLPGRSDWRVYL